VSLGGGALGSPLVESLPDVPVPVDAEAAAPGAPPAGGERFVRVGDIELCYEELGDPAGEPMLLVMGLGAQMIHWDRDFCDLLGARGFRVIRYDNRDSGHSTHMRAPVPGRAAMLFGLGRPVYTLGDMAGDAVGLLDHLEIESAHVVGASMGGMVAQVLAYGHPGRVGSLALIMTHSGRRTLSVPTRRALATLVARPARSREELVELMLRTFRVIGSPAYPFEEARFREVAGATWDRGDNPAGVARQLHATTTAGDRTRRLREIAAPTVVIHGDRDPLIRPANGRLIARTIPGAELVILPGMGHDLPQPLWERIVGAIDANAGRARRPAAL
jgi:pimeloyl-ACP methyl ester carboxylesterase